MWRAGPERAPQIGNAMKHFSRFCAPSKIRPGETGFRAWRRRIEIATTSRQIDLRPAFWLDSSSLSLPGTSPAGRDTEGVAARTPQGGRLPYRPRPPMVEPRSPLAGEQLFLPSAADFLIRAAGPPRSCAETRLQSGLAATRSFLAISACLKSGSSLPTAACGEA
jgi:hypothetical protein